MPREKKSYSAVLGPQGDRVVTRPNVGELVQWSEERTLRDRGRNTLMAFPIGLFILVYVVLSVVF